VVDLDEVLLWELRRLYWQLRWQRAWHQSRRRTLYRAISRVKQKFYEQGADVELIRCLCRHLANPHDRHAESRYQRRLSYV